MIQNVYNHKIKFWFFYELGEQDEITDPLSDEIHQNQRLTVTAVSSMVKQGLRPSMITRQEKKKRNSPIQQAEKKGWE